MLPLLALILKTSLNNTLITLLLDNNIGFEGVYLNS